MIFDQPLAVGNLMLKNRLVMVPVATGKAGARGQVTQALCDHYATRARGGYLGLVECGHHFVCEEGRATAHQASIAHDEDIEGLKREAEAVHDQGTPVFVQLSHAGSAATQRLTGSQPLAPSAVTCPGAKVGHPLPRVMSSDDIARVPEFFSAAARRAHAAGFDGVEIHAAHGYLLNQFLSPLTNLRTDAFGGSLENRARLLVEVLCAVRAELPLGYPVSVRLGGCDYMPGGNSVDDAVALARMAEAAGASLVSVSGGMCYYGRPGHEDTPGWFADSSTPIRAAIGVPVLLAGGIKTGVQAESLLEQGVCDFAGIGRAILNRPAWARRETNKLRAANAPAKDTTR